MKSITIYAIKIKKNKNFYAYKTLTIDEDNPPAVETIVDCSKQFTNNPGVAMYVAKNESEKNNLPVRLVFMKELATNYPEKKEEETKTQEKAEVKE